MPFFSKVFKSKDGASQARKSLDPTARHAAPPAKPKFASSWESAEVVMEEVEELIRACTLEMKSRAEALDTPFLLLPFRPEGDVSSTRTFIRNHFRANREGSMQYRGEPLKRELRLTEPQVLCSIIKWCWSRIPGGVVSWDTYESFVTGEKESNMVIGSFDAFIPISVDCSARRNIIYDFFDLLSSIAAHAKANGMGGRKLSRMAGWWAFEQTDDGKGLDGGYKTWADAADASSHLFFAYLRSRAPEAVNGIAGISNLPRSLQALVAQTEYPPETPALMQNTTPKVLMFVDAVSPTPFSLLRRARTFEYRAQDRALRQFAGFRDPVDALTVECRRVLDAIAMTNQNTAARSRAGPLSSTRLPSGLSIKSTKDETWSRFQDQGFSFAVDSAVQSPKLETPPAAPQFSSLQGRSHSRVTMGDRPTTPSWAEFTNAGFNEDSTSPVTSSPMLLAPEKMLPPIESREVSRSGPQEDEEDLEPGELASTVTFEMDDSFWWVWITSLASEEPARRKASFGRCALVETSILDGKWLIFEEQIKGASPGPAKGAYIAEKKPRFGFSRRGRHSKKNVHAEPETPRPQTQSSTVTTRRGNLTTEQKKKITAAAAAALSSQGKPKALKPTPSQRKRYEDSNALPAGLSSEVGPAMQWASHYDKDSKKQSLTTISGTATSRSPIPPVPQIAVKPGSQEPTKPAEQVPPAALLPQVPPPPPPVADSRSERTISPPPAPSAQPVTEPEVVSVSQTISSKPTALAIDTPLQSQIDTAFMPPAATSPTAPKSPSQASLPGRKPLSPESAQHVHPAFRAPTVEQNTPEVSEASAVPPTPVVATREPASPGEVSPEEPKAASPTETAKRVPRGPVIRKMFGKKREDWKRPADSQNDAARSPTPPAEKSPAVSEISGTTPTRSFTPTDTTPTPGTRSVSIEKQQPPPSYDPIRKAAHEQPGDLNDFNRFDQGPLDAPAFVPRESLDSSLVSPASKTDSLPPGQVDSETLQKLQGQDRPVYSSLASTDAASFVSAEEEQPDVISNTSRWAQIRKNAAERAAAAEQERERERENGAHTDRTDDGETSGEETIEERVARIKARVAQLTGNMDRSRPE